MRILFATLAANTHMFNMVPLAWALRAAGHEVCVASGPELIPDTTKAGLMAVAVGPQVDMVEDARQAEYGDTVHGSEYDITEMSPERLTWDYARNVLRVWSQGPVAAFDYLANDPTVDDLVRFSRYWKPDLVVWDATTYAGAIAARIVGAAQVRLLFGLDQVARIHQIFADGLAAQPGEVEDPLVEMITRKLARHDATFDPALVFGQLTLDPQPDWMRLSHEDSIAYHAVSPIPYNGPSVMPEWLAEPAGRRRICVTLGLSLREIDDHWGEGIKHSTLFEAVDGLDVDVIATASTEDLEGVGIPSNVKVYDFVPMTALLPHMSAIVHHGGGGTRMNAVAYGVPQVIIPGWSWDEEIWAAKLAERGAGVVVRQEELTAAKLRAALEQVLDTPSFASAATDVQKQAQACPTPADTVRVLEDLVRRHRTAR